MNKVNINDEMIFFEGEILEKKQLVELEDEIEKEIKFIITYGIGIFLMLCLLLFYLNFYVLGKGYFSTPLSSYLFFGTLIILFVSIFFIKFSFFLRTYSKKRKNIKKIIEIIKQKEQGLLNSSELNKIKLASIGLKFELNIDDKEIKKNLFNENLSILKEAITGNLKSYEKLIINNYNNYLLKISLEGKINGYNTNLILDQFNKDEIFILLNYVAECLKTGKMNTGEKFSKLNDESQINLFLSLKKALEKRYNFLLKSKKQNNIAIYSDNKITGEKFIDEDIF